MPSTLFTNFPVLTSMQLTVEGMLERTWKGLMVGGRELTVKTRLRELSTHSHLQHASRFLEFLLNEMLHAVN